MKKMRPCCVFSCPNPVRTGSRAQRMHSNTQRCPVPHVRCIKRGTSILDHSVLINTSLPAEMSRIDRAQFAGGGEEEIAYHPLRLVPPPSNLNLNSLPIDIGAICNRITNSNSLARTQLIRLLVICILTLIARSVMKQKDLFKQITFKIPRANSQRNNPRAHIVPCTKLMDTIHTT